MQFIHSFVNGRDGREAVVLYDPLMREYHVRLMVGWACMWRCNLATEQDAMTTAEQMVQIK